MRIGIIPAAGKGLRFKELGKQYPKAILPIDGTPIIVKNIQWLKEHGCLDIVVVINHQAEKVKNIVEKYYSDVNFVYQKEQNGLSSAILDGVENTTDEDEFLIVLGDLIVNSKIQKEEFEDSFIGIMGVTDYQRWCMVETSTENKVVTFFDKPKRDPKTREAVCGVYFFKDYVGLKQRLETQLEVESSVEHQLSDTMKYIPSLNSLKIDVTDFGTLEEYLQNKDLNISRSFNDITVDGLSITKSSKQSSKMIAEFNWFENLPNDVKLQTPRIVDHNFFCKRPYYTMERVLSTTVRDIWLYLDNSTETWEQVFDALFGTLDTMKKYESPEQPKFMKSMYEKTESRIKKLDIPVENNLISEFLVDFKDSISKFEKKEVLIHGDFCFSNIMYDLRMGSVKMIDPRGELFGSQYYDLAKLSHSVSDYDFIDAELYMIHGEEMELYNDGKNDVKEIFLYKLKERLTIEEYHYVILITASLFLSMIPLHYHNVTNQKAFYQKFKSIYTLYKELTCKKI